MRSEISFLREQSQKAYELAKKAFEDENYNWSIFLIEQALQLLLKYLLASKVGYFSKTHRPSALFEEASEISDEFRKFYEENRDKIVVVEDSYLLSRYLGKKYGKEDVEDKFILYEKLEELVKKHEGC